MKKNMISCILIIGLICTKFMVKLKFRNHIPLLWYPLFCTPHLLGCRRISATRYGNLRTTYSDPKGPSTYFD